MPCPLLGATNIPWAARLILGTLNTITSITSVLGNAYVVFIILYNRRLRRRTNFLLIVLAVTDFGVGLIAQPIASAQLFNSEIGNSCPVTYALTYLSAVFCGASSWILTLISYDRYLRMVKLQNYTLFMTEKKLLALISFCWLYPICFPIMMFFEATLDLYYAVLIISASVNMAIIFFFYYLSWKFVKTRPKILPETKPQEGDEKNNSQRKVSHHWRMAKAIAIVIACYLLAWSPMTVFLVFQLIWRGLKFDLGAFGNYIYLVYYITLVSGFSNSTVNPLIYYWKNQELKSEMRKFFCQRILGRKEPETITYSVELSTT